jgi:GNAT superfamily N-acetyltransferase
MSVVSYTAGPSPSDALLGLLREKYGHEPNFAYFLSEYRRAFEFSSVNEKIRFTPFALDISGITAGHAALIEDERLPEGEAFFGFLEAPPDRGAFEELWNAVTDGAREKGIAKLKGPVNGSIWHQYRAMSESDGSPFFASELMCERHTYEHLKALMPASEICYYSAYRERFEALLKAGKASYERLGASGFSITKAESVTPELLLTLTRISRTVFAGNWGYTELTDDEFFRLYAPDKVEGRFGNLYILRKGEDIIGFCGMLREDDPAVLVAKTIAVLPEYQGTGLGNALAYAVHVDAEAQGAKKIIYALIREGNAIQRYPTEDAVIFRRYSAFEFNIA